MTERRIAIPLWGLVAGGAALLALLVGLTVTATLLIADDSDDRSAETSDTTAPPTTPVPTTLAVPPPTSTTTTTAPPVEVIDEEGIEPGIPNAAELSSWVSTMRGFRAWVPDLSVATSEDCGAAEAGIDGWRAEVVMAPDSIVASAASREFDMTRRAIHACATATWLLSYDPTFLRDLGRSRADTNAAVAGLGFVI